MTIKSRQSEYDKICTIINRFEKDRQSAIIHVSGVPGSGKTYTVTEAVQNLKYAYVNCNNIKRKALIYQEIQKKLTCNIKKESSPLQSLKSHFCKCTKLHVLILDEIDLMKNNTQSFLYSLYSLPHDYRVSILLITISNSFDLDIDSRIKSRMGSNRIVFEPYKTEQLLEILNSKVDKEQIQKTGKRGRKKKIVALTENKELLTTKQFVARRIAAVSGDARNAIDLYDKCKLLSVSEANEKLNQKSHSIANEFLPSLTIYQKIFLYQNYKDMKIDECFNSFNAFCELKNFQKIDFIEFCELASELGEIRIIEFVNNKIRMLLIKDEYEQILKKDEEYLKLKNN